MDEETKKKLMQAQRESPGQFAVKALRDGNNGDPPSQETKREEHLEALRSAAEAVRRQQFENVRANVLEGVADMAMRWAKLHAAKAAGRRRIAAVQERIEGEAIDWTGIASDEGAAVRLREFSEYLTACVNGDPVLAQLPELREMSSRDSEAGKDEAFQAALDAADPDPGPAPLDRRFA